MEKETLHQRSHDSLHCPNSGKTKQITKWSVSSFKGKLKFFHFKIVKYETRAFKRKVGIKPIPLLFILLNISRLPQTITSDTVFASDFMHNSTGYVIIIGSCF